MQTQAKTSSFTTGARQSGADAFDDLEGNTIIPQPHRYLLRSRGKSPSAINKEKPVPGSIKYSPMNLGNPSKELHIGSTSMMEASLLDTDLPGEVEELLPEPFQSVSDKVLRQQEAANRRMRAYQDDAQKGNVSGFDNDYQGACALP